jgi:lipopolysaccharide export system protein LptA
MSFSLYSQQGDLITITGDSLIGRTVGGEMIREVYGNVVLTQGDVRITCNRAIQFISRNDAELIGNVVVTQENLTIRTPQGFYYGNNRRAYSNAGLVLDDQKVILSAKTGEYLFNEEVAFFSDSVKLFDTTSTLTSDSLTYFRTEDRAVAIGNVKIVDLDNIIESDSLEHFRTTRITFADSNVKIRNFVNNVVIYGNHLEDYPEKQYSIITENPLLVQIDTIYTGEAVPDSVITDNEQEETIEGDIGEPPMGNEFVAPTDISAPYRLDTLIIKSETMEAFRDTTNIFKAIDSVEIVRGNFASRNDLTIYYRSEEIIVTQRLEEGELPIIWSDNSQLTGDSITIHITENRISLLEVERNAFLISQSLIYSDRFDQISGSIVKIHFTEGEITSTEVYGGVYSIYYMYEEDEAPNGLTKSTSKDAIINFDQRRVTEVKLYGSPKTEFHPELKVRGNEPSFTLPGFRHYPNRPTREGLLETLTRPQLKPYEDDYPREEYPEIDTTQEPLLGNKVTN